PVGSPCHTAPGANCRSESGGRSRVESGEAWGIREARAIVPARRLRIFASCDLLGADSAVHVLASGECPWGERWPSTGVSIVVRASTTGDAHDRGSRWASGPVTLPRWLRISSERYARGLMP